MNKIFFITAVVIAFAVTAASAQSSFSLQDIIDRAKANSPASKQAETRKENRYWSYRFYKTNFNPQLRLIGSLPVYRKSVQKAPQPDGTFRFFPVEQSDNDMLLALSQPIGLTGGSISANTSLNYFRNYQATESLFGEQWSGSVFNVAINQPVFSFNRLRWDRKIEPLRFEESKRDYVEQMEFISREASDRFFNVLAQQINLQIATFNLANNDTIYKIEQGRYNIGTTSQDKLLQVELQLLRSRQDVAQARLDLETARLQLRSFIGLKDGESFDLSLPESIPMFDVPIDAALEHARANRADYIAFQRRRMEAERDLAEAKGNRFQTTLSAAYGLNNNGFALQDVYQDPTEQQEFSVRFSIPVLDWGRNKSMMRTAIANKKLNDYVIAQDEVDFEQEIITRARQFEMLKLQIEITRKADEVATQRYNVAQNRYLIGKIDITNLNIALTEKDSAKRSYIEALRSFWTAYYDLRGLTLYDFAENQLLYRAERD